MNNSAILDMLASAQGGSAISNIASRFGLDEGQARSAVEALLPALGAGVEREQRAGGLSSLLGQLQPETADRVLETEDALADETTVEQGNTLLGELFGSREVSRRVAADASARTGVDDGILKQLLPVIATMVVSRMAQADPDHGARPAQSSFGGLTGMLGSLAGGSGNQGGGLAGILGALGQQGGQDGIADDILGLINRRGR
ncbi:DUF937 domain-containing protein [Hyphobacterium marinum]|uniref:DUF937 domain-containing protein n=1 Tax=Hyphobacterium marinum TaxID=3116574 RepID=A0ABU7M179_9PROT|nr:DUF937 domain-containing protein [Hyphobacterium sp. Y6023]MEE2567573.1 DUF937 domain-containing protein [Hyphobacterium sp. Y6023]